MGEKGDRLAQVHDQISTRHEILGTQIQGEMRLRYLPKGPEIGQTEPFPRA